MQERSQSETFNPLDLSLSLSLSLFCIPDEGYFLIRLSHIGLRRHYPNDHIRAPSRLLVSLEVRANESTDTEHLFNLSGDGHAGPVLGQ